ncbi:MAG: hypothetical protein KDB58_07005 [Solirubrobacterales bacterium]|nr:hypothetical protein [Solirubrobacterales bacterium]MCB8969766.1 hypothetical protein [Thermoleophilales bacterium]MCO5327598.1 hypothetical protein [Solirubrobacterales bacterium]
MSAGRVFGIVLALLALAAIALMVFRPARVVGPSEDSLAHSLVSAANASEGGTCLEGGQGGKDGGGWLCRLRGRPDGASDVRAVVYAVDVDGWGCWNAHVVQGRPGGGMTRTLDGCITAADFARIGG